MVFVIIIKRRGWVEYSTDNNNNKKNSIPQPNLVDKYRLNLFPSKPF